MTREDAEWTAKAVKQYVDKLREADERAVQLLATGIHNRLNLVIALVSFMTLIVTVINALELFHR
jgi:phage tail tape-measure protein